PMPAEVMIAQSADDVKHDASETGVRENGLHVCCVLLNCLQRSVPLCTSTNEWRYYGESPSTRIQHLEKLQNPTTQWGNFVTLEIEASLELGSWSLCFSGRLTHAAR